MPPKNTPNPSTNKNVFDIPESQWEGMVEETRRESGLPFVALRVHPLHLPMERTVGELVIFLQKVGVGRLEIDGWQAPDRFATIPYGPETED